MSIVKKKKRKGCHNGRSVAEDARSSVYFHRRQSMSALVLLRYGTAVFRLCGREGLSPERACACGRSPGEGDIHRVS